ncbi:MAG TPA: hypothetical protein VNQ73_02435 [Ilumatobacter sp.]|nr:hypothetical protein [Ilumatobacter sp.]
MAPLDPSTLDSDSRLDNPLVYDPFTRRVERYAHAADAERARLSDELLLWEAAEAAHGYRHLTIVHGDSFELAACRHVYAFTQTLRALAADCEWVRIRGGYEYITVTVRGAAADERIAAFAAAAHAADTGGWTIMATAFPPLT